MHFLQPGLLYWFYRYILRYWLISVFIYWLPFLAQDFLAFFMVVTTTYTPGSFPTVGDPEWLIKLEFDLELCRKQNNHTARKPVSKKRGRGFSVASWKSCGVLASIFLVAKICFSCAPYFIIINTSLPLAKLPWLSAQSKTKKEILLQNPTQSPNTLVPLLELFLFLWIFIWTVLILMDSKKQRLSKLF